MSEAPRTMIPPKSKESEMMVLGCMLTSVNSLNIAADALKIKALAVIPRITLPGFFTQHRRRLGVSNDEHHPVAGSSPSQNSLLIRKNYGTESTGLVGNVQLACQL